jgi:predicted HicB family RNase H-like nuclease
MTTTSRASVGPRPPSFKHFWKETSAVITEKQERYDQVLTAARHLAERDLDWVTFFREVLGVDGIVRKAFSTFDELTEFEKSEQYDTIQRIIVKLREKKGAADNSESEPTRVITVRLPKSMHEYLRTEAHDLRTSMNKLCISKLLQVVEQDMIPAEKTAPARRRSAPAPQPVQPPPHSHGNHTATSNPPVSSPFTTNGTASLKTNW